MVTSSAPSFLAWTPASMAVMPPPITTTRRPTGSAGEILGLADLGDELDGRTHHRAAARPSASARTPPRPMPRKTASKSARSVGERQVAAEARALADGDAADAEEPRDLGLGEAVHRLVGGDAELVEPAGLGAAVHEQRRRGRAWRGGGRRRARPGRRRPRRRACPSARRGRRAAGLRASACRWRSAAGGRSRPACPRRPRARRPPRRGSRSGRRGRTCRRGCSARGSSAPPPRARREAISRMNIGMSIEVGQAVDAGRVVAEVAAVGGDQRLVRVRARGRCRRSSPPAPRGSSRPLTMPGVCGLGAMDLSVGACGHMLSQQRFFIKR